MKTMRPVTVQIAEITMIVEIYADENASYEELQEQAREVIKRRLLDRWNAYCE